MRSRSCPQRPSRPAYLRALGGSAVASLLMKSVVAFQPPHGPIHMSEMGTSRSDSAAGASRRDFLNTAASLGLAGGAVLGLAPAKANALRPPSPLIPPPPASPRPFLWEVLMSDPPQMQPYTSTGEKAVLKDLASTCCAVFLGEHFDKPEDNQLQTRIIEELHRKKPRDAGMAIGLEMVQQPFQPALDRYIAKEVADQEAADEALREETEWDERWGFEFERYLPVLRFARANGIRLLALNVGTETLQKVREVGLEGLEEGERRTYVADQPGFIQSVKDPKFKLYAERFVLPTYAERAEKGELGPNPPTASRFFASRIFWDETMATVAAKYLKENPRDVVVMLVGADHIKYGMGAPSRLERLLTALDVRLPKGRGKTRSILLNPTPPDTGSKSRRLQLTLGYASSLEKCRPVSDYMWFSNYPKVSWLEHPQNAMDRPYRGDDVLFQIFPDQR